ncbi:hypothetical protein AB0O22_36935, partial [Streptomyces sp. NPDC091204]|uniref:hypothetical protein n=1 Tax=Streptomyces sp. NPDC091204 TaxID=3155299 RepID=UPI00343D2B00
LVAAERVRELGEQLVRLLERWTADPDAPVIGRTPLGTPRRGVVRTEGAVQEAEWTEPVLVPLESPTKQVTSRSPNAQVLGCG